METTVTINFAGGTASTDPVQILVQGAQLVLDVTTGVALAAPGLTNLSIRPDLVAFASPPGGQFNGTIGLLLSWSGDDPAVTLNNLAPAEGEPATIVWPAASGPVTQVLTPGTPMTLYGLIGS